MREYEGSSERLRRVINCRAGRRGGAGREGEEGRQGKGEVNKHFRQSNEAFLAWKKVILFGIK